MKNRFNMIIAFIVMSFLSMSVNAGIITGNSSAERLYVKGSKLVNEDGKNVVLRGVSYGWHNWWPRFYNASTVRYFAQEWNANVVRAVLILFI